MRRFMVLLLLLAVAVLGWWLFANVQQSRVFRLGAPKPAASQAAKLKNQVSNTTLAAVSTSTVLLQPRYTGQDNQGRAWQLTAASAGQSGSATSGTYVLSTVTGQWDDPSQTQPLTLQAEGGEYTQNSQNLSLKGNVVLTGAGLTLQAPKVDADLATREVQASGGTQVQGRAGGWNINLAAPQLTATQNNSRIVLTGGVHAILTPSKAP